MGRGWKISRVSMLRNRVTDLSLSWRVVRTKCFPVFSAINMRFVAPAGHRNDEQTLQSGPDVFSRFPLLPHSFLRLMY